MKKRNIIYRAISFAACCILTFTFLSANVTLLSENVSAANSSQIQTLEDSLSKIQNERKKLQSSLNSTVSSKNSKMQEKRQLDSEISVLNQEISTTENLISQYTQQISDKEIEVEQLKEECEKQQKLFDEMVRMSFEYGDDSYLEMIFGTKSFSDFLSRLDLISYHLSYNDNILKDMDKAQTALDETVSSLKASKSNLEMYTSQKEELKKSLEQKSAKAEDTISALLSDQKELEKAIKESEDAKKQLQSEIEALYRELGGQNSEYSGGDFIWPLPSNYKTISSGYGYRTNPLSHKKEFHNGIDLPAPKGTNIRTVAAGTVVKATWYGGFGNCVIINHGGGIMSLYGHCNSLNVKNGQYVNQGDVIAFVGTSGYSTGNHLHLTIYKNGNHVSPLNYVKK